MGSEWTQVTLEDICLRITSGGTPSRRNPAYYEGGGWPWVKTQELQDGWIDDTEEHITEDAINSSSAKVLPEKTVLLAMYGATVGQLGILRRTMTCNQACCALIADPDKADFRFLYFYLLKNRSKLKNLATGAAQQNLSGAVIKSLHLLLPSLVEQRAIAHILGTLDDKIELNRQQNKTLEEMARALFKAWFVDFEPVRAKMEGRWQPGQTTPGLPAHLYDLFPDRLVETEQGEIPQGWRMSDIKDCCMQVQNGGTPRRSENLFWEGGTIPWLTSGEVRQAIIAHTESFVTEAGLRGSSAKWIPELSTVVALYGATAGQVSLTSFPLTTNQAVCALIPKDGFSYFNYLSMRNAVAEMEGKAVGSAQQNISKGIVEKIQVIYAPAMLMEKFSLMVEPFFDKWISNLRQSRALVQLRDTLLPKMISGELRIADAKELIEACR